MAEENTELDSNEESVDSSVLNMSDAEFENSDWMSEPQVEETTEEEDDVSEEPEEEETESEETEQSDTDEESDEEADSEEEDEDLDSDEEDSTPEDDDTDSEEDETEVKSKADEELAKLYAPFKANGQDMQVNTVDEAIQLMQMGVGFQAKMAKLKPNLKLMRMLDNNDLLDESKLSFLIDLNKKDPDAINKLIKDADIDPLTIDKDKAENYKPNTYTVDDKELEISDVLENISGTKNGSRTVDVISNKWDSSSKQVVVDNPNIINVINGHMDSGIYDQIVSEVSKLKMLGQLSGLSDLESYKAVGDILHAEGKLIGMEAPKENTEATEEKPMPDKTSNNSKKLKSRKKATSSPRTTKKSKPVQDFNPLALSDEDFEKMGL